MKTKLLFLILSVIQIHSSLAQVFTQVGSTINAQSQPGGNSLSGNSVKMSQDGNILVIGEPGDATNGQSSGQVRVMQWNGSDWVLYGNEINGTSAGDSLGFSVDISADGQRIAVGIPRKDGNYMDQGQVIVYQYNAGSWVPMGTPIEEAQNLARFGLSLSLDDSGTKLFVGSPDYNNYQGAAYAYEWNGSVWATRGSLQLGINGFNSFGTAISCSDDGNTFVSGAYQNNTSNGEGYAIAYEWNATNWQTKGDTISDPDITAFGGFGTALSLDSLGERLIIGEPGSNVGFAGAGAAYIYEFDGVNWLQMGTPVYGTSQYDELGKAVAISGDGSKVVIGANNVGFVNGRVISGLWTGTNWIYDYNALSGDVSGGKLGGALDLNTPGDRLFAGANGSTSYSRVYDFCACCTDSVITVVACDGFLAPSGTFYDNNGIFVDVSLNANGCDSILTINLTVNNSGWNYFLDICGTSYTSPISGITITSNGTIYDTLTNTFGCDSVIITAVQFYSDPVCSISGNSLVASGNQSNYQWINCTTNTIIPGATSSTYTPTQTGSYAFTQQQTPCVDTSNCVFVSVLSIDDLVSASTIIYPNPASDRITIESQDKVIEYIDLMSMNGTRLKTIQLGTKKGDVAIGELSKGCYFLAIHYEGMNIKQHKFIKE